jgi:hypothetical protein
MRLLYAAILLVASSPVGAEASAPEQGPVAKDTRTITFAKREWRIKVGEERGPGPNQWSGRQECVRVDDKGYLHIAIAPQGGAWSCSELIAPESLGYGDYRWVVAGDFSTLSPRSVLGLFLYQDDTHEIDFELSRWGEPDAANAQFVMQPSSKETKHRFDLANAKRITCEMRWSASAVHFQCWAGEDTSKPPLADWTYRGPRLPRVGRERVHMNFWLFKGKASPRATRQEVVIQSFEFKPSAR